MIEKSVAEVKNDFHSINNLLNKITTQAGVTRYQLEEKSIDLKKIEEEKAWLVKVMDAMEENALKIGEILKKLRRSIYSEEYKE